MKPTPPFLEDAIMAYLWIKDMPDSFMKRGRLLRCLLRFYLMLINPSKPELLDETWIELRNGGGGPGQALVQKEEDVLPMIKKAVD